MEREALHCTVSNHIDSKAQLENIETTSVVPLASEQLLSRIVVAGIPVYVKETVKSLVLETLTAN